MQRLKFKKWITQLLVFVFVLQSVSPSLTGITAFAASTDEEVIVIENDESQVEVVEGEDTVYDYEDVDFEEDQRARDEEDESCKVDDSYKLSDTEEISADQGLFSPTYYSNVFKYTINGLDFNGRLDSAVSMSVAQQRPIFLKGKVEVYKTVEIPSNQTVEIYTNGYNIEANTEKLGNNPLLRVKKGATLRIYGKDHSHIKDGRDGAIIAENETTLTLTNLNFNNNSAGNNGGAIYLGSKVNCTLNNVWIDDNYAGSNGGGLYINGGETNVHINADTEILRNRAGGHGGAIYVDGEKVNIYGPSAGKVKVYKNYAKSNGGAIYGNKKKLNISSLEMTDNKADGYGGAVYFDSEDDGLTNCIVKNNTAGKDGGGIYINGTADYISDVEVTNNLCGYEYFGGGIYVDSRYNFGTSGKILITNNHFGKNESALSDLFLQKGKTTSAYVKAATYAPGSKIGIGATDWKEGRVLSFTPGNYNPKQFYANYGIRGCTGGEWYVANNNKRELILTKSKDLALDANEVELDRTVWKTKSEKVEGRQYVTAKGEKYEIYYGYISSPSHTDENKDILNKYFYSDGYFMDDPAVYNNHLATLGMNFAMASADSNVGGHNDYSYKFDNVKSAMMGIGCKEEDIYISPSYIVKPTTSSIGVAIGQKQLKTPTGADSGYVLVPITFRSYGYEKEWASNMTLNGDNTSAGHESSGFRDAATQAANAVDDYIDKFGLTQKAKEGKLKFFLTGFSRGSATANLVSKRLVDKYGSLSTEYKDNPNQVFGYCYAVPAGGTDLDDLSIQNGGDGSAYYCIHNIINKVDLTPMVAPKQMGFKRYGVDHYVPGGSNGTVQKNTDKATEKNGSYPITTFYDNTAYLTNSSSYSAIRGSMTKQLMYVNDEIHFVDYFKEADINLGKAKAVGQFVKGMFTESQYVSIDEVSDSNVIIEDWLPSFYQKIQEYDTVGKGETLTRSSYSEKVIKAGSGKWADKGTTAQDTFRGLVEMMLSKTPTEKANLGAAFSGVKNKMGTWQMYRLYENLINNKEGWDKTDKNGKEEFQTKYLDLFWGWLTDSSYGQKSINTAITDPAERAQFQKYFPSLLSIVMRVARKDFTASGDKMRLLGTFAYNTEAILQGHVPEIALAWLRVNDDYYANEKNAYVWKKESTPDYPNVTAYIDGKEIVSSYDSSKVLKLKANNPQSAMFYTVKVNDSKESIKQLYNDRRGIKLSAPENGKINKYTISVWTYTSYAEDSGKTAWLDGGPTTFNIDINKDVARVKVYYNLYVPNKDWSENDKLVKELEYNKGDKVIFDANKLFTEDILKDKTLVGWKINNGKLDRKSPQVYVVDNITDNCNVTLYLAPQVETLIFYKDLIDSIKPIAGQPLARRFNVTGWEQYIAHWYIRDEESLISDTDIKFTAKISWMDSDGKPVFTPKAEAGKTYKAVVSIPISDNDGIWRYSKSLKVNRVEGSSVTGEITTKEVRDDGLSVAITLTYPETANASPKADEISEDIRDEEKLDVKNENEIDISDEEKEAKKEEGAAESTVPETTDEDSEEIVVISEEYYSLGDIKDDGEDGEVIRLESEEIAQKEAKENTVTFKLVDINSNTELLSEDAGTAAAGDKIYVDYEMLTYDDAFNGYDLVSWKVNDEDVSKDKNDPYFLEYTMPDADVVVTAYAATSVDAIDLDVYPPETGGPIIDNPLYLMMKIGGKEYELDPESAKVTYMLNGSPCEEAVAKANTEYSALVTIKASDLKLEPEDESEPKALGLKFFGDSEDIETKEITGFKKEGETSSISLWIEDDEDGLVDTINIFGSFEKTEPAFFLGVVPPETLEIGWDEATKNNRYKNIISKLPEVTNVAVEDDSIDSLEVIWDTEFTDAYGFTVAADDLNGTDSDWSLIFYGKVKIPAGMMYEVPDDTAEDGYKEVKSEGTDTDVVELEYPVTLEGAPFTANPSITPTSGLYDPDDGGILVSFDPGVVSDEESNEEEEIQEETEEEESEEVETEVEDIHIYYLISPLKFEETESGDQYPVEEYTRAEINDGDVVFISEKGTEKGTLYYDDMEDYSARIIDPDDEKYKDGAIVYAVAVKDGTRLSPISSEVYVFMEAEVEPEDIDVEFEGWTLPIGGKLGDLTKNLPAGCNWHPDVKTEEVVTGNVGDIIKAKVVYNPDPTQYENTVIEFDIELVSGAYDIIVEGGKVSVYDDSTGTETPLTELKASAGTLLVFAADAPKEGEEFDGWIVYDEMEEAVPYEIDDEDSKRIGVVMPAGTLFAKALYAEKETPSVSIDKLSFEEADELTMNVGDTRTMRAIPSFEGKEISEKVSYVTNDTNLIEITEDAKTNSVSVKAKETGKAVVWAYCGDKAANCTITISRSDVSIDVYGGAAYNTMGEQILEDVPYGTTVVIKANKPRNEATAFDKWEVGYGKSIPADQLAKSEITFQLVDDVAVEAQFTVTTGFEDKSDYAKEKAKVNIKSLSVTDGNNRKMNNKAQIKLDGRLIVKAEAKYATSEKPDIVLLTSNSDVVKVKMDATTDGKADGVIIGNQPGTARVTVACGNKKFNIDVTVEAEAVNDIVILSERITEPEDKSYGDYKLELNAGEQEYLDAVSDLLSATNEVRFAWKSDDNKVATVKNGLVTAKFTNKANTTITVTPQVKPIGAKNWTKLDPIKIAVSVKNGEVPKKSTKDKSYSISVKGTQNLDIDAANLKKINSKSKAVDSTEVVAKINKFDVARNKTFTWKSTNEDVVTVTGNTPIALDGKAGIVKANIKATGIGTAYIVLEGKDPADETKVNTAVVKVVVKATAPNLRFLFAVNGNIKYDKNGNPTLTMKAGSYDKLVYMCESDLEKFASNTTEKITLTATGGVTVKNGLIYAKKATKKDKPAKVTLKCGKNKLVLYVTVE